MLEFLGLGIDGNSKPPALSTAIRKRRNGDVGIEHFSDAAGLPLHMLTPDMAAALRSPSGIILDFACATVIVIANHRLAHSTDDDVLTGTSVNQAMEMAFEAIPSLVQSAFYDKLGSPYPS